MPVKVKDHGAEGLMKRVKRLDESKVIHVGVLGNKATEAKLDRETGATDLTVVQVAEKHEFGIGVPRRSFIRDYHDQNQAAIKKRLEKMAAMMWKSNAADPGLMASRLFGSWLVDGIVTRIETGIPPSNSQETIDRKGSEKPLIDTGQLKSSITYKVVK